MLPPILLTAWKCQLCVRLFFSALRFCKMSWEHVVVKKDIKKGSHKRSISKPVGRQWKGKSPKTACFFTFSFRKQSNLHKVCVKNSVHHLLSLLVATWSSNFNWFFFESLLKSIEVCWYSYADHLKSCLNYFEVWTRHLQDNILINFNHCLVVWLLFFAHRSATIKFYSEDYDWFNQCKVFRCSSPKANPKRCPSPTMLDNWFDMFVRICFFL